MEFPSRVLGKWLSRWAVSHAVKPMNHLALRVKHGQIDVALLIALRPPPLLLWSKFLPPHDPDGRGDLAVIAMAVPARDNERFQLLDYLGINQRGPPDLRCGCSAVARSDVTILGVDDNQDDRTTLSSCLLLRVV